MNSLFDSITQQGLTSGQLITWSVAFILVLALIISFIPVFRYILHERRLAKAIRLLGLKSIRNVILPDGVGGSAFIDYLVLQTERILVVMLKRYRGTIFCADNIDQWTQLVGQRSFKFPNPLRQNEVDVQSVRNIAKNADIEGVILFHGQCDFPKGKPEQVLMVPEVIENMNKTKAIQSEKIGSEWDLLMSAVKNHQTQHEFASSYFKNQIEKQKFILPAIFLILLTGWLYLRIFLLV